jgi:hypothetical protein
MMLEQAEANLKNLKPLDIVAPVNPKYTIQEWLEIYAAQKAAPEKYADFKKGTTPQPGNDLSHRIYFSFFFFHFYMDLLATKPLHLNLASSEPLLLNSLPCSPFLLCSIFRNLLFPS